MYPESTGPNSPDSPQPPGAPPPLASAPPPLPAAPKPSGLKQFLALALTLCLGLFLADAFISLADDTLILLFNVHALASLRGLISFFGFLLAVLVYVLMALTPLIPKRLFLPVTLFNPLGALLVLPVLIYAYGRMQMVAWLVSLGQVLLGLFVLARLQGGLRFRWPLVREAHLEGRSFSAGNFFGFVLLNLCVLLPASLVYLFMCASLAVGHYSQGFLALHPRGFQVQARTYERADGKTIQLVPMVHIGDARFYSDVATSFPTNSLILMEGVTDQQHLLTNRITYHRVAASLGLAEQQNEFQPARAETLRADVDVSVFTPNTLGFLNLVMYIHGHGLDTKNLLMLLQYSPPPGFEERLFDDLLHKRNQHVLEEIQAHLPESDHLVVPWGAAHIPGIAQGVQAAGFHLKETHDYQVIRFGGKKHGEGLKR